MNAHFHPNANDAVEDIADAFTENYNPRPRRSRDGKKKAKLNHLTKPKTRQAWKRDQTKFKETVEDNDFLANDLVNEVEEADKNKTPALERSDAEFDSSFSEEDDDLGCSPFLQIFDLGCSPFLQIFGLL